jgi:hypothetical protein
MHRTTEQQDPMAQLYRGLDTEDTDSAVSDQLSRSSVSWSGPCASTGNHWIGSGYFRLER